MTFSKILLLGSVVVFVAIGATAIVKKKSSSSTPVAVTEQPKESKARPETKPVVEAPKPKEIKPAPAPVATVQPVSSKPAAANKETPAPALKDPFPAIDRIDKLFTTGPAKLPIVETVTYSSSVPWLKGRPAWVADYAAYHGTSRHFIARSLNNKPDYFSQKVTPGSKFNVFRNDKHISFYLLIDLSLCKMGFYYVDLDTNERVLLKTYRVGLGRLDAQKPSGSLTPMGKYTLGDKVAIYKPGTTAYFQDKDVEMITIFGTRWLPFDQELDPRGGSAKGYGIHGLPWKKDQATGQYVESRECLGKYESDGSVRLAAEDMEEIFAIVLTKPTIVEIVKEFRDAKLPGLEVVNPR